MKQFHGINRNALAIVDQFFVILRQIYLSMRMDYNDRDIYPVLEKIAGREKKENLLNQQAQAIWMTGLSGSGKTTNAIGLEQRLLSEGFLTQILDGDNIRSGINNNLGFSLEDRLENIRRIAEISKLFINCGIITINCFVSPTIEIRNIARQIIGEENFLEIYLATPLQVCEQRDVKGLYKKARNGEIKNFTGIDSPFEPPKSAFYTINTNDYSIAESVDAIYDRVIGKIKKK